MTSLRRKILFYTFILIFLITTPLVILYAIGYKIDLSNPGNFRFVQKTGMILLETKPTQAKIYIDDKIQRSFMDNILGRESNLIKTPAKIKGLLPGEYQVRLELDGYWPWNKKINIYSGQITHLQDISLFRRTSPLLLNSGNIQEPIISPNNKKIFLPLDGLLIDLKNENLSRVASSSDGDRAAWSDDGRKLLTGKTIYDTKDISRSQDLKTLIGSDTENIKWNENDSNKIYYQYKDSINYFDLDTNKNGTIIEDGGIIDYLPANGNIFYVSGDINAVKLKMFNTAQGINTKEIEMPYCDEYEFWDKESDYLELYDKKHSILYIIDPFSFAYPLKEIVSNIRYADWVDQKTLLYANEFEIWKLDMESLDKHLITRISDRINNII
ncbi:PEGA domain-containing protein, partial [Candidatus Falkowbacteria bacterium]|nr:PEGA domain-containing protein [Candidatus Falkowbacteria bacterium]